MCDKDSDNSTKQEYDIYFDERKSLVNAINSTDQQYDKAILTLSAGALALSLTFIGNISPSPIFWTKWIIASSWICFVISMLTTLISFFTSKAACERQIEIIEGIYKKTPDADLKNQYTLITKILNFLSVPPK